MSHHGPTAAGGALQRRRLLALLAVSVAALVGACGKKGPLRLPEPPPSTADSSDEEAE
jgi:predicted small lipoprotein YifL